MALVWNCTRPSHCFGKTWDIVFDPLPPVVELEPVGISCADSGLTDFLGSRVPGEEDTNLGWSCRDVFAFGFSDAGRHGSWLTSGMGAKVPLGSDLCRYPSVTPGLKGPWPWRGYLQTLVRTGQGGQCSTHATESKLMLFATWQGSKSRDELLGEGMVTLFGKPADWEDGGLASQRAIPLS